MTKKEVIKKIRASKHSERCKLAMIAAVEILENKVDDLTYYDQRDVVDLANSFYPIENTEVNNKLKSLGVRWREASESYRYYPPEEWI